LRLFSFRVDGYCPCDYSGLRHAMQMSQPHERPRLLVLDLLESYARERDIHVLLERRSEQDEWVCVLKWNGAESRCVGRTAREAITDALRHEGVYTPD
jgi:hypothetical protein